MEEKNNTFTYVTQREATKLFINFLKQYGALEQFRTNLIKEVKNTYDMKQPTARWILMQYAINPLNRRNIQSAMNSRRFNADLGYFLRNAFNWFKTKEGYSYWHSLHQLWEIYSNGKIMEPIK